MGEKVVLNAVQEDTHALHFAFIPAEVRATLLLKVDELRSMFGRMSLEECARVLLQETVCQVDVGTEQSEDGSRIDVVVCTSLAGESLVATPLTSESCCQDIRLSIATSLQLHP